MYVNQKFYKNCITIFYLLFRKFENLIKCRLMSKQYYFNKF